MKYIKYILCINLLCAMQFVYSQTETITSMTDLPLEIKTIIITHITQTNSLDEAINNLKNVPLVNKEFNGLMKNPIVTRYVIQSLAQKFSISRIAFLSNDNLSKIGLNKEAVEKYFADGSALTEAIYDKDYQRVYSLLRQGVDSNYITDMLIEQPRSALMIAAYTGNADVVRVLLEHGANPNYKNTEGLTALDIVTCQSFEDMPEVVELLLKYGAKPACRHVECARQYGHNMFQLLEKQMQKVCP
ncbi:MAG TPA: ankyrin repeat domain-containing protein [Candidatus Dependentiae bacterium]|nr:ankyrin repeat domain-containing protein [Candidatus Dependentiae bacterium]HRQ62404.1 ankyrin repeat domain-containing protein [Candidatus Dependentiae bacterium]